MRSLTPQKDSVGQRMTKKDYKLWGESKMQTMQNKIAILSMRWTSSAGHHDG